MTTSRNLIRPRWNPSAEQIDRVCIAFPVTNTAKLASELGVAPHQVGRLARALGLRKDLAYLNGPAGGRLGSGDSVRGAGCRYQPGNVPWTKGKKGLLPTPATAFKPGHRPHNFAPVGSLRVNSGGYLQIKLQHTGYPPADWVMYHRHVWQQAHGPVPAGHVVAFRRGRSSTVAELITLDDLECITQREHMLRHTFHQHGPEIAAVTQLRAALSRQINHRTKQA